MKVELPPWKIWKADVSSISPSSERIEELWVAVTFYEGVEGFAIDGNVIT